MGFGADGDGFIYWLELGFVEDLSDLKSILGGSSPTWNTLLNSGKLKEPSAAFRPLPVKPAQPLVLPLNEKLDYR